VRIFIRQLGITGTRVPFKGYGWWQRSERCGPPVLPGHWNLILLSAPTFSDSITSS